MAENKKGGVKLRVFGGEKKQITTWLNFFISTQPRKNHE